MRIGGARVGQVSKIEPQAARGRHHLRPGHDEARQGDRAAAGRLDAARAPALGARPQVPRARRPGASGGAGFAAGATIAVRQARPAVVELDDFFNMFDDKARVGSRNSLDGYGGGLAGRGRDLNTAIEALRAAAARPRAGGAEPGRAARRGSAASSGRSADAADRGRAGGRGAGVAVREPGHHVHRARLDRAARSSRRRSPRARRREEVAIREFPLQRPFLRNNAPSSASCGPAWRRCRTRRRSSADAFEAGTEVLPTHRCDERGPGRRVRRAGGLLRGPAGARGRGPAHAAVVLAAADAALPDAGPDHLQLRHAVLPQRGERALRRRRERHLAALHDHGRADASAAATSIGPNNEGGPSSGPGERARSVENHLHLNPYPNTASPGQSASARPATSATRRGQTRDRQPARQPGHEDRGQDARRSERGGGR